MDHWWKKWNKYVNCDLDDIFIFNTGSAEVNSVLESWKLQNNFIWQYISTEFFSQEQIIQKYQMD
jgi:hypothetical protein